MKNVLVLLAHPALEKSRVNAAWAAAAQSVPGVTLLDLYERYPEFDVDASAEQQLLARHDVIVFQHPLYWYSIPALLKQWFDIVLEHGWAYGTDGNALQGKIFMQAISTGGREDAYCQSGTHEVSLWELLAPIRQTARLCKMQYLPPFVAHGAFAMSWEDVRKSAHDYALLLRVLATTRLDMSRTASTEYLRPEFIHSLVGEEV